MERTLETQAFLWLRDAGCLRALVEESRGAPRAAISLLRELCSPPGMPTPVSSDVIAVYHVVVLIIFVIIGLANTRDSRRPNGVGRGRQTRWLEGKRTAMRATRGLRTGYALLNLWIL